MRSFGAWLLRGYCEIMFAAGWGFLMGAVWLTEKMGIAERASRFGQF